MAEAGHDIFISYERQDAQNSSLLLYKHLTVRFGQNAVFRDKQKIISGAKWEAVLKKQVLACKGFILMIGPDWNESRIQLKLRDPDNWVRKEILTALDNGKPIFPVFMRDDIVLEMDDLPDEIQPALQGYNHFRFHDGPNWEKDLDRLCADIARITGLTMASQIKNGSVTIQERVISRLDRNKEIGCVNKNFGNGKRLFLASGGNKAGFRYFAVRCALDAMRTSASDSSGYQEIPLSWSRYAKPEEKTIRHAMLVDDITETLLKIRPIGNVDSQIELIKRKLRETSQPTVLHTTLRNYGRGSQKEIDEWYEFWSMLLSQQTSTLVAVILFVEQSVWSRLLPKPICTADCQCIVNPMLGKVERNHFEEWTETELRKNTENQLYRQVKKMGERLFRFSWKTHDYEDVSDAVLDIWADGSS